MKHMILRWAKRLGATIGIVAALGGGWAGYLRLSGNVHPVEDGAVYRSAQLNEHQFTREIKAHGIRTILNLRGNNTGQTWYDAEIRASTATGVQHVDFPLSARTELTDQQVSQITTLLRDLPRPLLIHCEGGADRTGLASAIYELSVEKRSAAEASEQLSFRYGHFPWLGSATIAMDRTFARIVSQLTAEK